MIKAYFLSDLHLRSMQERNSQTLLRFLHWINEERIKDSGVELHVFLVGDIFDLWINGHAYFVEKFRPVVDAIAESVKLGVHVHYFEGNHDLYLKEFWQNQLGVEVVANSKTYDFATSKVRVEHGDLINPDDRGYLFLRAFLRHSFMVWFAHSLPGSWVQWIGQRASQTSREYTSTQKALPDDEVRSLIRRHAQRISGTELFDLLVTGHVHVRDDHKFEERNRVIRSINLGSWMSPPYALLVEARDGQQLVCRHLLLDAESGKPQS